MRGNAIEGAVGAFARLAAVVTATVAVALLFFIGTQVDIEAASAIFGAEWVIEDKCCMYSYTWADVLRSATIAITGAFAIAALAYLTFVLVRFAALGPAVAQARRTHIAIAVLGGWTLVFLLLGWRP